MGGAAAYVRVNGQRLAPGLAYYLAAMAIAFNRATGMNLLVSSGRRLKSEQEAIFRARYVPVGQVAGRRVYDYRWWNGTLWARISPAGTVAAPGTSLHESDRAVDVRDSGSDAGVTVAGNARSNWIRKNAHRWGFSANGYNFGEPWHLEFQWDPWFVPKPQPKPKPEPTPPPAVEEEEMIRAKSSKSGNWYVIGEFTVTTIKAGKNGSPDHQHALAYSLAAGKSFPVLSSASCRALLDDAKARMSAFFTAMGRSEYAKQLAADIDALIAEEN